MTDAFNNTVKSLWNNMKTLTIVRLSEYSDLRERMFCITDQNQEKITKNQKQAMSWSKRGYLQLVIKIGAQIDMHSYLTTHIIPPKMANKEHASQVMNGWQSGAIKWVVLSEDEIEE